MNASAGLYRQPSGRLERELEARLVGTRPMKAFGRAIIGGDVQMVKAIASVNRIPKSWYTSAFDEQGRKLVSFAVHVALRKGMTSAYEDILWTVIKNAGNKSHITTCLLNKRHECVAHVVAQHATETHHVNKIGNMVTNRLQNHGATWHAMLGKKSPNGRVPGNHAKFPAIGQHMGAAKNHVSRNNSRSGRTQTTNTLTNRELQSMIDQMTESQMIAALSMLNKKQGHRHSN